MTSHSRSTTRGTRYWCLGIVAGLAIVVAMAAPLAAQPDAASDGNEGQISATTPVASESRPRLREPQLRADLLQQIDNLGHTSYRTRQLARWRLEQTPQPTLEAIAERLEEVDYNIGSQLIDLLGALAAHTDVAISLRAREILARHASQVSSLGRLANNALRAIADLKENQAIEVLLHHGAKIGTPTNLSFNLNARVGGGDEPALRLDESFHGDEKAIEWIQFLKSIETVYLQGEGIDSRHYRAVSLMQGVKNLKLKHVRMTVDDLKLFKRFEDLEHLGLNYVNIDDAAVDVLVELPVSQTLRLYGTQISLSAADRLAQRLDGIEIYCGRGGYLGVGTDPTNTVVSIITPGSGAQLAGIQLDDELTAIESVPIKTFQDMRAELGKYHAGDTITVTLERPPELPGSPREEIDVEVTLGEDPN